MSIIYFDNNATTRLADEVLAKMNEIYKLPITASASHLYGQMAVDLVENSRQKIKKIFNAKNHELIFTAGASEANNMVMFGCDVQKIFLCPIEHSSIYYCRPENKQIIEVAALNNGLIDIDDLEKKLIGVDGNFMVNICLANNETGAIQDVKKVVELVRKKGGLVHSDIVQAAGKIAVDLADLDVDFASISSHKIRGPQGVGALFVKKGINIKPLIYGSKQENGKRAGTHNVAGIVGFAAACELIDVKKYAEIAQLRDFLEESLEKIAGDKIKIFSAEVKRIPNTSYISLLGVDKQKLFSYFAQNKICVSDVTGCLAVGSVGSNTLKAMKINGEFLSCTMRVSLGVENTIKEVEKFIEIWREFYLQQN